MLLVLADFDVDGVRVETACFGGFGAGDCYFDVWIVGGGVFVGGGGGVAAGVGGDVDFGGDEAFERVLVEWVEEALELMPVLPDFAERHRVDYHGEE